MWGLKVAVFFHCSHFWPPGGRERELHRQRPRREADPRLGTRLLPPRGHHALRRGQSSLHLLSVCYARANTEHLSHFTCEAKKLSCLNLILFRCLVSTQPKYLSWSWIMLIGSINGGPPSYGLTILFCCNGWLWRLARLNWLSVPQKSIEMLKYVKQRELLYVIAKTG